VIDITEIPGLFGLFIFKLAVVLDVFSRIPIAGRLCDNRNYLALPGHLALGG
jgi:hypothetical protein